MLALLACGTACPSDDVPMVPNDDDGSTGEDSTGNMSVSQGPTTLPPPDTSAGTTTTGVDTTEGPDSSGTDTMGDPCGNGMIDDGEDCDGDDLGGADCAGQGFVGGELGCNDDCTFDTAMCNDCGNDAIDDGEDCDGTDLGGADCMGNGFDGGELGCGADCTFDESMCFDIACGDGMINAPEVCDGMDLAGEDCMTQGFDGGMLACDAMNCRSFDTSGCFVCGDDMIGGMEVCDGTDVGAEDCMTQGFDGGTLACAMDCSGYDTSGCYTCGDGVAEGPEVCDGMDLLGEDCVTQGFDGGTLGCAMDCSAFDTSACTTCGDGVIDPGEDCDGMNLGGETCLSQLFFGGGALGCAPDCTFDTAACIPGVTTVCSTPGLAIGPDGGTVTTDTLVVPAFGGGGFVTDVNLYVDALHTYTGDLDIELTQIENSTNVQVFDQDCGTAEDILATFDQDAAALPDCVVPIAIEGDVLPDPDNLESFSGIPDVDTTWQIDITDNFFADGGTLNEWCVTVEVGADPTVCGDGLITFGEDCDGADLAGQDCISLGYPAGGTLDCDAMSCQYDFAMCDPSGGICGNSVIENDGVTMFEDCDTNELNQGRCETLGFVGGSLGCGFPDCGYDTSDCSNGVIAVCNDMLGLNLNMATPIQSNTITLPDPGTVADVDVFLDVSHAWVGDLDIRLFNDTTGDSVDLILDECGSQDDVWMFLNDEGDPGGPDCLVPIAFEGNLQPENPLSIFDGSPIAGDWRLEITDDFATADHGVWNEWCIYITP